MSVSDFFHDRLGDGVLSAIAGSARGNASWARAFAAAFVAALLVTAVSGVGLSFTYAPSAASAWASVYFTEYVLAGGWYVRSLHTIGAEASLVLGVFALVLAVVEGRYRGKRDLAFWARAVLLALVFVFCITGNPLRWDNRGYFGLVTETNIAGELPGGSIVRALALGGTVPGNWTLARMYALHTVLLPLVALLALGAWLRTLRTLSQDGDGDGAPAPGQLGRDAAGALVATIVIAVIAYAVRAPLEAPADPVGSYNARPEWYFQSLYVLRNAVPAAAQAIVAGGLPVVLGALVVALPLLDRDASRSFGKRVPLVAAVVVPAVVALAMTLVGLRADARDPALTKSRQAQAKRDRRALQVAHVSGIPPAGALTMMREDPILRGEDLFREHCASCHRLGDMGPADGKITAPTLDGWGTEKWIVSLLEDPDAPEMFGTSGYKGKMPSMTVAPKDPVAAKDWKPMKREEITAIARFLAAEADEAPGKHEAGAKLVRQRCTSCHLFRGETDDAEGLGPELAGWGSTEWTRQQIANPGSNATYRPPALSTAIDGHMPRFDEKLSAADVDLLARFVRHRARVGAK